MNINVGVMKEAMVSSVDLPSNVGIHDRHHRVSRAVPQVVVHGEEDKSGGETPEPNHAVPQFVEHYKCIDRERRSYLRRILRILLLSPTTQYSFIC